MSQTLDRIREVRYAHNPADFPFRFPGQPPADLSLRLIQPQRSTAPYLLPAVVRQGELVIVRLTVDQMRQVVSLPGSTLAVEVVWFGIAQFILEIRATYNASAAVPASLPGELPGGVIYAILSDQAADVATKAAADAIVAAQAASTALDGIVAHLAQSAGLPLRLEFALINHTAGQFRHGFGLAPQVSIQDGAGREIGAAVRHIYPTPGSSITNEIEVLSNQPINGKLIVQL